MQGSAHDSVMDTETSGDGADAPPFAEHEPADFCPCGFVDTHGIPVVAKPSKWRALRKSPIDSRKRARSLRL